MEVQRSTDVKLQAMAAQVMQVQMDLNQMNNRVILLERQNAFLTGQVNELQARVVSVERRLADVERALGYLMAHH